MNNFVDSFFNNFKYDLIVCIPVEFELSESEKNADKLRWVDEHRYLENEYVNNFFNKEKEELRYCNKIIMVTGSVEERIAQINKAIDDLTNI